MLSLPQEPKPSLWEIQIDPIKMVEPVLVAHVQEDVLHFTSVDVGLIDDVEVGYQAKWSFYHLYSRLFLGRLSTFPSQCGSDSERF